MSTEAWAAVSAISAAVAAIGTFLAIAVAAAAARGARRDASEDRRARIRPMIVPELERELLAKGTFNLVIRNHGLTAATNVAVGFDPALPDPSTLQEDDMRWWVASAYAHPVSHWPPGWKLTNVIRSGWDHLDPFALDITYAGPDGHTYSERYELDPRALLKSSATTPKDPVGSGSEVTQAWLTRIATALEALVRTIR